MAKTSIFEIKDVSKRFGGTQALKNVSFSVEKGEIHCLVGENGAGKSTLMNVIAGVIAPDSGEIIYNGGTINLKGIRERQNMGISMVHQEINLFPNLSIAKNVFAGREPKSSFGNIKYKTMLEETKKLFGELECEIDPETKVEQLSTAEKQLTQIITALSFDVKVIIMDEPNSALTEEETNHLFNIIRMLKTKGVTVILISHRLEEVISIADRISVLRDGEYVGTISVEGATPKKLCKMMIGKDMESMYPPYANNARDEVLLEVKELSLSGYFHEVSFKVKKGEVLGIAGLKGCGRVELAECIVGDKRAEGNMYFLGENYKPKSTRQAIEAGVVYLPSERRTESIIPEQNIAFNIALASLDNLKKWLFVSDNRIQCLAKEYKKRLEIKAKSINQLIIELSGGNQQKVVFARVIATEPLCIVLNEPTRGIDVNSKYEIYLLIQELASRGIGIIVISAEMPELMAISDRIITMWDGYVTAEFKRDEKWDDEEILNKMMGEEKIPCQVS
jgi:ABC-type sugar transport system ATPase subunit